MNTNPIDRWIKVASVVASCAVVPGIAWAFKTTTEIQDLRNRVERLDAKVEASNHSDALVLEEVRAVRASVEALRTDVLQRLVRVETQIQTEGKR